MGVLKLTAVEQARNCQDKLEDIHLRGGRVCPNLGHFLSIAV